MIAYVQGTFDLFHTGHVRLLKKCKNIADIVIVALLSDEAITDYRGKAPIITFNDRKEVLESCKYVSKVIMSDHKQTKQEILSIHPDFVVVGSDWAKKDIYKQYNCDRDFLDQYLVYFPYTPHISSTSIKKSINE
jgi:glycerol-3-phosphate cytidylyltransferase